MPTHMLFNSDDAFESRENIEDSEFKEFVTWILLPKIMSHYQVEVAEIESIIINDKTALIYDRES